MSGPANYDYEPPSPKFHRNGSHILPQGYRGLANSHKKGTSSGTSNFCCLSGAVITVRSLGWTKKEGWGPCKDLDPSGAQRRFHRTPDLLVQHYLLTFLVRPALRGRLRARALVEHVKALVEHEPVVAVAITVYVVLVAVLGIDEIEAKAGEDPVSTWAAVERVVAIISVESVSTGATRELVGCAPADEQVARAEAQEGVLTHVVPVGAEELVGLVVADAQRRQGQPRGEG